ncbi:hypothetical protein L083_4951 [Actinoplanes sp. N902-109]|nr:hypothetical protein L083_4951 [Actinoplanes sp. N902-109]
MARSFGLASGFGLAGGLRLAGCLGSPGHVGLAGCFGLAGGFGLAGVLCPARFFGREGGCGLVAGFGGPRCAGLERLGGVGTGDPDCLALAYDVVAGNRAAVGGADRGCVGGQGRAGGAAGGQGADRGDTGGPVVRGRDRGGLAGGENHGGAGAAGDRAFRGVVLLPVGGWLGVVGPRREGRGGLRVLRCGSGGGAPDGRRCGRGHRRGCGDREQRWGGRACLRGGRCLPGLGGRGSVDGRGSRCLRLAGGASCRTGSGVGRRAGAAEVLRATIREGRDAAIREGRSVRVREGCGVMFREGCGAGVREGCGARIREGRGAGVRERCAGICGNSPGTGEACARSCEGCRIATREGRHTRRRRVRSREGRRPGDCCARTSGSGGCERRRVSRRIGRSGGRRSRRRTGGRGDAGHDGAARGGGADRLLRDLGGAAARALGVVVAGRDDRAVRGDVADPGRALRRGVVGGRDGVGYAGWRRADHPWLGRWFGLDDARRGRRGCLADDAGCGRRGGAAQDPRAGVRVDAVARLRGRGRGRGPVSGLVVLPFFGTATRGVRLSGGLGVAVVLALEPAAVLLVAARSVLERGGRGREMTLAGALLDLVLRQARPIEAGRRCPALVAGCGRLPRLLRCDRPVVQAVVVEGPGRPARAGSGVVPVAASLVKPFVVRFVGEGSRLAVVAPAIVEGGRFAVVAPVIVEGGRFAVVALEEAALLLGRLVSIGPRRARVGPGRAGVGRRRAGVGCRCAAVSPGLARVGPRPADIGPGPAGAGCGCTTVGPGREGVVVLRRGDAGPPGGRLLGLGLAAAPAGAGRFLLLERVAVPERGRLDAPGPLHGGVPALRLPVVGVELAVVVLQLVEVQAADGVAVPAVLDLGLLGVEVGRLEAGVVQPARPLAVERLVDLLVAARRPHAIILPSPAPFGEFVHRGRLRCFGRTGRRGLIVDVVLLVVVADASRGCTGLGGAADLGTPAGENGGFRVRVPGRGGRVVVRDAALLVVVLGLPVLVVLVAHRVTSPATRSIGAALTALCAIAGPVATGSLCPRFGAGLDAACVLAGAFRTRWGAGLVAACVLAGAF